ncbi:MAG: rod-binding protein [Bdellovibrionaceae bacterium]|nr:rod-binding protein [Pseudobdellovibrionaceae bacterium]
MIHKIQKALPIKETTTTEKVKTQFREVSDMYEKHFLREMMKSMRSSVPESGLIKVNSAEKIFREQLDSEYVEKWGERGGVGISDLIYNDLVDKYGERFGLKAKQDKPVGPLQLGEKDSLNIRRNFDKTNQNFSFHFDGIKKESTGSVEAISPWSGLLSKKIQLGADEFFLELNHDNGLSSQIKFRGLLQPLNANDRLNAGDKIGILSPDTNDFFWNLKSQTSPQNQEMSEGNSL